MPNNQGPNATGPRRSRPAPSRRPRPVAPQVAVAAAQPAAQKAVQPPQTQPRKSRKIVRNTAVLSILGIFAFVAGNIASKLWNEVPAPSGQSQHLVLKGPAADRIVANFSKRDAHLARAALVVDEHLCYVETSSGPTPTFDKCQTLKDLRTISASLGAAGVKAFERLDLYVDSQYLPDIRGNGGILTSLRKMNLPANTGLAGLFQRETFWGASVDVIVRTANEYIAEMRKIDSKRFEAEVAKFPRVQKLLRELPGTANNPICWNVDFEGPIWKSRGCKVL